MNKYIFTDLANEMMGESVFDQEILSEDVRKLVEVTENHRHVIFFSPKLWLLDDKSFESLKNGIISELGYMISKECSYKKSDISVMIIGLGNPYLTTDSLGSETVKRIIIPDLTIGKKYCIKAVAPNVEGNTGINTVTAIKAYVDAIRPDVLIAVDALRARSYERLASTVQISDGGIAPGGGLEHGRSKLSYEAVGIPVISVGVPVAVNSSTMIIEVLRECGINANKSELKKILENNLNFLVTPKESDLLIRSAAILLSSAINGTLQT